MVEPITGDKYVESAIAVGRRRDDACRASDAFRRTLQASSAIAVALAAMLGGCAGLNPPSNHQAKLYDPEKTEASGRRSTLSYSRDACPPSGTSDFILPASIKKSRKLTPGALSMRYSPGDRMNIFIFGSPEFSGDYVINVDGKLILPFAGQIDAVGLTNSQINSRIEASMVNFGIYERGAVKVSVRPVQYAPINVTVAGAVFFPGRHAINGIRDSDKLDKVLSKFGDSPSERFLPAALRAAGGVRPDADLSNVKVTRNGRTYVLDWRGAITGAKVDDMPLIEGDHVEVSEGGCFQSALVRPSQITVAGIRIFTSNLTAPAFNNSLSTSSQQLANGIPYGTRLLQGLVSTNCVGGTRLTNASRHAVLISRNPKTRQTEVVQRSIEELVRSADRDKINPYLMPDDAIACYDSNSTEFRDVMATLQAAILPFSTATSAGILKKQQ